MAGGERNTFDSRLFHSRLRTLQLADTQETVLDGLGRYDGSGRPLDAIAEAFADVPQLAVIGYKSQGPAQANALRKILGEAGSDTRVVVGLRPGSESRPKAEAAGFDLESGTLMTTEEALGSSAMSLMLISDADMARDGHELVGMMPEGATLGLSHGFWLGHLQSKNERPRPGIDIVGVCPKGMGPSVWRLLEQGSGINTSFAVQQGDSKSRDHALAWAAAIGAYSFQTTLDNERNSDVFGERAMLLGGVHGILEAMYPWKLRQGKTEEGAYTETVESLVGPISKTISKDGLKGVVESLGGSQREQFIEAYNAAYPKLKELTSKLYTDVSSGREIAEVVSDHEIGYSLTEVDGTDMWRAGEKVRANRDELYNDSLTIDPTVAGIYIAGMMAQVDVLRANGHHWSEVVNESIIEAVDSLNPYMRAQGVAYMVDNCSETARRGARKWGPHYQAAVSQAILPVLDGTRRNEDNRDYFSAFESHDVHGVLETLGRLRPNVSIAV